MTMSVIHTLYIKVILWSRVSFNSLSPGPSVVLFLSNCSLCFKVMTWLIFIAFFCPLSLWLSHFNLSHYSCVNMGQSSIFHLERLCSVIIVSLQVGWLGSRTWLVIEYLLKLLGCDGEAKVLHYRLNLRCDSGCTWPQFCPRVNPRRFPMVNFVSVDSLLPQAAFVFENGNERLLPYSMSGQMHQIECFDQLKIFICESLPLSLPLTKTPPF